MKKLINRRLPKGTSDDALKTYADCWILALKQPAAQGGMTFDEMETVRPIIERIAAQNELKPDQISAEVLIEDAEWKELVSRSKKMGYTGYIEAVHDMLRELADAESIKVGEAG